jgi:hypothetical protein
MYNLNSHIRKPTSTINQRSNLIFANSFLQHSRFLEALKIQNGYFPSISTKQHENRNTTDDTRKVETKRGRKTPRKS